MVPFQLPLVRRQITKKERRIIHYKLVENPQHRGIHERWHTKWKLLCQNVPKVLKRKILKRTIWKLFWEVYQSEFGQNVNRCYGEKLVELIISTRDCPDTADVRDAKNKFWCQNISENSNMETIINNPQSSGYTRS